LSLEDALSELQDMMAVEDVNEVARRMPISLVALIVKRHDLLTLRIDANGNHKRPHLHIDYGKQYHTASYAIDNGERLIGTLTRRYDNLVRSWINTNRTLLMTVWGQVAAGLDATALALTLAGS